MPVQNVVDPKKFYIPGDKDILLCMLHEHHNYKNNNTLVIIIGIWHST